MDEKFWARVDVKEDDECWEFKNQPSQIYGVYNKKIDGKWKAIRPHRYAWSQHNGRSIPDGLFVCHSCDNPKCCNPTHLWLGTNSDNILDAIAKFGSWVVGQHTYIGEKHHSSKLTEEQVLDIRARVEQGERQVDLAKEYNVTRTMLSKIILRKSWKHI